MSIHTLSLGGMVPLWVSTQPCRLMIANDTHTLAAESNLQSGKITFT